jgi:hypothetical protein
MFLTDIPARVFLCNHVQMSNYIPRSRQKLPKFGVDIPGATKDYRAET